MRLAGSHGPSRIAIRLLAFNLLLLFLPIAGILYLDVYEARLLEAQERAMVQQARLVAAALSVDGALDPKTSAAFITRLGQRGDTRLRIYDAEGVLVADSNNVRMEGDRAGGESIGEHLSARCEERPDAHAVSRRSVAGAGAARRGGDSREGPGPQPARFDDRNRVLRSAARSAGRACGPIRRRDASDTGAAVADADERRSRPARRCRHRRGARVAVDDARAAGALRRPAANLRSRAGVRRWRLRCSRRLAAATVARPIGRLRRQASDLAERRSRLPGVFYDTRRRDEIGDLARALQELTRRLHEHIRDVERFASDVSHEFKNPLASIRTAAEMAAQAEDPRDRARFLDLLAKDVDRLDRLVSDVRDLARIDTQLEQEPLQAVDVGAVMSQVIDGLRFSHGREPEMSLRIAGAPLRVAGSADRLAQAFENILSNARSFAPSGTAVDVDVRPDDGFCRLSIADRGPGIPSAHIDRVFERFFTYRLAESTGRGDHAGLGLAIARTIVQGYGGTIAASNRPDGGACFEIRLPRMQ